MSILPECIAVMQSDFRLSNAPEKVKEIHEFEDIISTDHKLISFTLDFDIAIKLRSSAMSLTTRADWNALNDALIQISPWHLAFVHGDIDASLANGPFPF